jgi:hypothetical protein
MINQKLFGVVLTVAALATSSVLLTTNWSQNASASAYGTDIDLEEAAVAENTTSAATNKTTSENMTGANSTRYSFFLLVIRPYY